ncbi:hypothetical protein NDR89_15530 [Cupriavidus gilardii]|uniref:Replication initiation protein n=1 Tax=Cupriavidus gilardii TaxID=82541 RepID=A0ABY4VV02_9BURK|nr:hypothetical protein [Cupriavidus gilardii]USE81130.1 hypothetical protein NDR89_15530 [Cupriavidus gilardii]
MAENEVVVSRQQLYDMVWSKPMSRVAEDLSVPHKELRDACRRLGVPCPSSGYWEKVRAGKTMARPTLADFVGIDRLRIATQPATSRRPHFRVTVVPADQSDQLHPLVEAIRYAFTSIDLSASDRGRLRFRRETTGLTCTVSPQQLDRALLLWNCIVRSAEASGLSFSFERERTYVSAFGHRMWVRLFESVRQEPDGRWTKDVPTGRLRFYGDGPFGAQSRFSDEPGRPLEQQIEAIIAKLLRRLHNGIAKGLELDQRAYEYRRREKVRLQELARRKAEEEAKALLAQARAESVAELRRIYEEWLDVRRFQAFFSDIAEQAARLPSAERLAVLLRVEAARKLICEETALGRIKAWQPPEERIVPGRTD